MFSNSDRNLGLLLCLFSQRGISYFYSFIFLAVAHKEFLNYIIILYNHILTWGVYNIETTFMCKPKHKIDTALLITGLISLFMLYTVIAQFQASLPALVLILLRIFTSSLYSSEVG